MRYTLTFAVLLVACSGSAITEAPQSAPCPDPTETEAQPPHPSDAGEVDAAPLECPTCETCEVCSPPHLSGVLRCDELDPLFPTACTAFAEACASPSCPVDWPIPVARHYLTPQAPWCLNGLAGAPACQVPGKNNEVFIDCCADPKAVVPTCDEDDDCPAPVAECWDRWCNGGAVCGVDTKPVGTPCSIGHCESGRCVP